MIDSILSFMEPILVKILRRDFPPNHELFGYIKIKIEIIEKSRKKLNKNTLSYSGME